MSIDVLAIHHLQITVPFDALDDAVRFYGEVLALERIPKPGESRKGGAWFRRGGVEVHVSGEASATREALLASKRHFCCVVRDLGAAEEALRVAGVTVVPDDDPVPGWRRFYVRDPGGNRIEIAQAQDRG